MVLTIDQIMERLDHIRSMSGGNTPCSIQIKVDDHIVRVPVVAVAAEQPQSPNACVVFNGDES